MTRRYQQRDISNQSFNQRKKVGFVCAAHMHIQPSDTKVYRASYAGARLASNPLPAYGMDLNEKNALYFDEKRDFLASDLLINSSHIFF